MSRLPPSSSVHDGLLVAYCRERERILTLTRVMKSKRELSKEILKEKTREEIISQCWNLIKSDLHQTLMVFDSDDVLQC